MNWDFIINALSDSRVLIGVKDSAYLKLFRVNGGLQIESLNQIILSEQYTWFSATSGSHTLVAMSYNKKNEVRMHRLLGDRLDLIARIEMQRPERLLWFSDRLFAVGLHSDSNTNSVTKLEVNGTQLKRRHLLFDFDERIRVDSWCAVDDWLAIFDSFSRDILHYKL